MLDSDSGDEEYIPKEKVNSSISSSDSELEEPDTKRPRTEPSEAEESETQQRNRKELWKAFKESLASGKDSVASATVEKEIPINVRIEKRYMFAGKEITEVVEVPADSAEAKKWPPVSSSSARDLDLFPVQNSTSIVSTSTPSTSVTTSPITSDPTQKPIGPKRGPRKSKIALGEISGSSSGSRPRPTKLTTLEKSAMDWRSHISGEDSGPLKDELEANRKQGGGGYLEKMEFLGRVSERREGLLEASKSGKRRRG